MLPQIQLDDIHFQELVSEARTRIVRHSPDWTEHNVSDPGITLIELFAWLTEILVYRINRIPERLHFGLLALVGVRPGPPQCATTELRFMLDRPASGAVVPTGTTVASPRTVGSDPIIFQTGAELVIPAACRLAAYGVQRGSEVEFAAMAGDAARPAGAHQAPFAGPPRGGNALLLGFDSPIAGLVIRLTIESPSTIGADHDWADFPLAWEASRADGDWQRASVVPDKDAGLVDGDTGLTLQLPATASATEISGERRHWLRCRVVDGAGGFGAADYDLPEISAVMAAVAGATVVAHHAGPVVGERLGTSEGIPGVAYRLQCRPVLTPRPDETLEVREAGSDRWTPWERVDSFSLSEQASPHFLLDTVRGEVRFGPAIRQPDGGWRRFGAVPPAGSELRMSGYRHGGGNAGNVAPRALTLLVQPVPKVASVTNPHAAAGGGETETLEGARERARLEIRARTRAVTGDDFERLTLAASPRVARAVCVEPGESGSVRIHVLPRVAPADRLLEAGELIPDSSLMELLASELDQYRLLGTSVRLLPVRLRGVSVVVDVRASPLSDLERVQHDVAHALYVYLNPLIGGSPAGAADGWPRGRALNLGELFGIVYGIAGVEFVNILRMYETDLLSGEQAPEPTESQLILDPDELIASGRHIVKAIHLV